MTTSSAAALQEGAKQRFYAELEKRENGDSVSDRKAASKVREAAEKISCFYCLDYTMVYKDREGMFANLDGQGNYDIINCIACKGNEDWVKCSSGPGSQYPGIMKRGNRERHWFESRAQDVGQSLFDKLKEKIAAY